MITVLSAITLMLTSCGVSALKGGNTEVGSKGNSTNSTREGRFFKTSDEEDVEGETALHKETPAYPELEPIPYIPDTAAGFPSDGSFPCVGSEAGYYDEYGHYHYSADDLYSEMYNACMEHREEIYLNGVFEDADFQKATKELWAINPDLFWMEDIRYQIFEDWTARLNLVLYDGIDLSKLPSMHDELLKKADEIIAMANELPTDYEKIKFVHDHIIENTEYEKLEHIMRVNLEAPLYLISKAVPNMKHNKWGRIINIGSISGVMGEACASLYSASKSGLIGGTKALALELAEYGITQRG